MKRAIVLILAVLTLVIGNYSNVFSQDVLNGIYVKERDKLRKPIPWVPLREADVMWSKTIQRKIDLREKINHPLYYPTQPILERMSFIDLLLAGIKGEVEGEPIIAYDPDGWAGEEFNSPMTFADIEEKFDAGDKIMEIVDVETGDMIYDTIAGEINSSEVKQYLIKEIWYFDRKYSTLQVRIVGICPIREFQKDIGGEGLLEEDGIQEITYKKLFWVSFDQLRPLLANHEVFNPFNDAERRSFDDIFYKRKFGSYVVQESNVYNDRNINQYSLGSNSQQEAERVKQWIFETEHDLWSY